MKKSMGEAERGCPGLCWAVCSFSEKGEGMKVSKFIMGAVVAAVLGAGTTAAKAGSTLVTVNGVNYDVSVVTGTFNDLQTELEGTPWWGNEILATDLFVAHSFTDGGPLIAYAWALDDGLGMAHIAGGGVPVNVTDYYAVGEVVPAPEPTSLCLLGLGAIGLLARRRRTA